MRLLKLIFCLSTITIFLGSCRMLRPSLMLKTEKDYKFTKLSDTLINENYKIAPTDAISYRIFSNDGFKLIDISTQTSGVNRLIDIEETIDNEGFLKAPLLGKVKLSGLKLLIALNFRYSSSSRISRISNADWFLKVAKKD